jgi:hypothetical protein
MKPVGEILANAALCGYITTEKIRAIKNPLEAAIAILEAKQEELLDTSNFRQGAYRTVKHAREYLESQLSNDCSIAQTAYTEAAQTELSR